VTPEQRRAHIQQTFGDKLSPGDLMSIANGGIMDPNRIYLPAGTVSDAAVQEREAFALKVADIVGLLRAKTYRVSTEALLQSDIETALTNWGLSFTREHRLSARDRIDFLIERGIGIEAKTRCGKRPIFRQLQRYTEHDSVKAIVLITGTALGLPPTLNGKPLFYVSLGRAAL
jgi:hypothetical protein